jgi:RNA polymerase sigma-70 factor, ECF subfamily
MTTGAGTPEQPRVPERTGAARHADAVAGLTGRSAMSQRALLSDGAIARSVLAGDTDLFGILIQRHQDSLHRVAYSMVQDTDVASDLVQDALIRAFSNLHRCRDTQRFRVWVMAMLRNRCLDYLKERRRRDVPLDAAAEGQAVNGTDALNSLAARTELQRALDALPPTLREAFLLRHVEDMTYEDIAEVLDATVAGVKMRVSRAREALRQQLNDAGRGKLEHHR